MDRRGAEARRLRTSSRRDGGIPSSTASGWGRRARRRCCSTGTTTCSRSTRRAWVAAVRGHRPRRRNYARGSADDKGQIFMHFKAIEAHLKQTGKLPINMKVILEGEEEVGSENLDDVRREQGAAHRRRAGHLGPPMFDRGMPSICYGLRGLVYSRSTGAARRPTALRIVRRRRRQSGLRARANSRAAQGSRRPHQDSRVLRRRARAARGGAEGVREAAVQREALRKELGAPKLFGESGYTTLERVWAGRRSRSTACWRLHGRGAKTVIPAVAMAKVSMRLVPNQDPDKIAELFEA